MSDTRSGFETPGGGPGLLTRSYNRNPTFTVQPNNLENLSCARLYLVLTRTVTATLTSVRDQSGDAGSRPSSEGNPDPLKYTCLGGFPTPGPGPVTVSVVYVSTRKDNRRRTKSNSRCGGTPLEEWIQSSTLDPNPDGSHLLDGPREVDSP